MPKKRYAFFKVKDYRRNLIFKLCMYSHFQIDPWAKCELPNGMHTFISGIPPKYLTSPTQTATITQSITNYEQGNIKRWVNTSRTSKLRFRLSPTMPYTSSAGYSGGSEGSIVT